MVIRAFKMIHLGPNPARGPQRIELDGVYYFACASRASTSLPIFIVAG